MTKLTLLHGLLLSTSLLAACDKGPTPGKAEPATAAAPTPTTTEKVTEGAPAVAAPAVPAVPAAALDGQKFGAGVSMTDTVDVDALLADPTSFKGKTVRVEGMVLDVCPKRGCWFEMAGGKPGAKLKFKVTDGEMVFPVDAKGKYAVAQGEVSVRELNLEESKEYAEYQAKEYGKPFDPASVKPMSLVQIAGTGAVFRDKK